MTFTEAQSAKISPTWRYLHAVANQASVEIIRAVNPTRKEFSSWGREDEEEASLNASPFLPFFSQPPAAS